MSKKKLKKRVKELEVELELHKKQTISSLKINKEYTYDSFVRALERIKKLEQQNLENIEVKDAEHVKSEELTELPEMWCIKANDNNIKVLYDFASTRTGSICTSITANYYYCFLTSSRENEFSYLKETLHFDNEYTEITTEQFKKWVLKEEIDWDKPQFLINNTNDNIVFSTGKHNLKLFEAVSIKDNYSSDGFLKCRFKPIPKGTEITITV